MCRPMGGESIRISAKGDFLYMHPWLAMLDVDEMARIGSDRVLMACGSAELEIESCWVDVTGALDQSEPTATPRQAPLPGVFPSVQAKLVAVEEKSFGPSQDLYSFNLRMSVAITSRSSIVAVASELRGKGT